MEPENGPLEDYVPLGPSGAQVACWSLPERVHTTMFMLIFIQTKSDLWTINMFTSFHPRT